MLPSRLFGGMIHTYGPCACVLCELQALLLLTCLSSIIL